MWGISSGFPLANHFHLSGPEPVFGLIQDPPTCPSASLSQDGFQWRGLWVAWHHSPSNLQGDIGEGLPDFEHDKYMVSRLLSEKAMATHPSTLAWKIPWTKEPGGLQSMGSLGVRHDWATSLSLFTFLHWRRKWQPTPVFLPGESQGRRSLVGCRLWGRTESDTTEAT